MEGMQQHNISDFGRNYCIPALFSRLESPECWCRTHEQRKHFVDHPYYRSLIKLTVLYPQLSISGACIAAIGLLVVDSGHEVHVRLWKNWNSQVNVLTDGRIVCRVHRCLLFVLWWSDTAINARGRQIKSGDTTVFRWNEASVMKW